MKAVILAGGLGSRISEETGVRPKPMAMASPAGQNAISPASTTSQASGSLPTETGVPK